MISTNDAIAAHKDEYSDTGSIIDRIADNLIGKVLGHAKSETIFGAPVERGDCTVVPVGRVSSRYGFGGGSGEGPTDNDGSSTGGGGGGGGGGALEVRPVGYIEITSTGSRFVQITDSSAIAIRAVTLTGIVAILFVLGLFRTLRSRR